MKYRKVSHTRVAVIVSTSLFLYTFLATGLSGDWSTRNIYNLFYFFFLNFTILTFNAIIFSKKRRYLNENLRRFFRVSIIFLYSALYIILTSTFISTGQIARIQTVLFLSNTASFQKTIITLIVLAVMALLSIIFINKKTHILDLKKKNRKKLKILFTINLILLMVTLLINFAFLEIENSIISDESQLISYQFEKPILQEKLGGVASKLDRPNVIFILLESTSAEHLGIYGNERNVSPNMDDLANKGILFENIFSTSTHSDYAQPGLLSSRYIFANEYRNLFMDNNPKKFIWDVFKESNYTTGYFSSQDDRWQGMNTYLDYSNLDNFSYSITDGKTDYGSGYAKKDFDHRTSASALNWLNDTIKEQQPFFLYLNFQATHNPMIYEKDYSIYKPEESINPLSVRDKWVTNRHDNALTYVDAQVGKILSFLEENNLSENTVIAITSDHGHDLKNRHNIFGHGKSIYNEELLVPGIMFFPKSSPKKISERVSHIDFIPTLIDSLGYSIPKEFQGDVMRENKPVFFVAQSHKYLIGMIQNNTKVIVDVNRNLVEVYDLENDPQELIELNPKDHRDKILKLLFWHYCQKDYYENNLWKDYEGDRCTLHNNFKI